MNDYVYKKSVKVFGGKVELDTTEGSESIWLEVGGPLSLAFAMKAKQARRLADALIEAADHAES